MTEFELLTIAHSAWSQFSSWYQVSIAVLSGYLVVAYIVGRELTRFQVSLVNFCYVLVIGGVLFALYKWQDNALEAAYLSLELTSQRTHRPGGLASNLFAIGSLTLCHLASFIFMWNVRHPRT